MPQLILGLVRTSSSTTAPRPVVLPRGAVPAAAAVAAHGVAGHAHVLVLVLLGLLPILAQTVVVLDEVDHVGDLVADVDPLVLSCKANCSYHVGLCSLSRMRRSNEGKKDLRFGLDLIIREGEREEKRM